MYLVLEKIFKTILKQVCYVLFFHLFILGSQETFANGAKVCECYIA